VFEWGNKIFPQFLKLLNIDIMTISLIDVKVFRIIRYQIINAIRNRSMFSDSTIICGGLAEIYVKKWFFMNRLSFSVVNRKDINLEFESSCDLPSFPSHFQILKWLNTIKANIDIKAVQVWMTVGDAENQALSFLDLTILSVMAEYMEDSDEYRAAKSLSI
jgi:hypothetical protein